MHISSFFIFVALWLSTRGRSMGKPVQTQRLDEVGISGVRDGAHFCVMECGIK